MSRTRVLIVVALVLVILGVMGKFVVWRAKPVLPYSLAKVGLPKLSSDEPTSAILTRIGGMVNESFSFPNTKMSFAEQYVKWLKNDGWKSESENLNVDSWRVILRKDKATITINFYSARGTYLKVSRPEAEYDAPATGK
jgi:hypothetical protein